ncbi:MAG: thiamine pyrophosphate-dependent enzyme [Ilumatobacteraceae bacterium]
MIGKLDEHDRPLIPGYGALDADHIVPALRGRLESRIGDRLAPAAPPPRERIPVSVARTPFFCSGCPHNRSTVVPEGTLVGAGIGCHTMVLLTDDPRVGDVAGITAMGNEGTQWIGMAPFVETAHLVQNLGDGTYFHSGQLAITAAVAAGVDVTYKLLYNGAVSMTGGQHPEGQVGVPELAQNLLNVGVARVLITTDDPRDYRRVRLPKGSRSGTAIGWSRPRRSSPESPGSPCSSTNRSARPRPAASGAAGWFRCRRDGSPSITGSVRAAATAVG